MNRNTPELMSEDRSDREIRRFLEWDVEGIPGAPTETEMVERVARATRAAGVRDGLFRWTPTFRIVVVLGLLAFLLVSVYAVGALWNRPNSIVSVPSPTIGPTARPFLGQVGAGSWYFDVEAVRITFVVPDGWVHGALGDLNWIMPPGDDRPALLLATTVTNVMATPCGLPRSPAVGPSVDDLATAFSDLPGLGGSTPVEATVDGYLGKQLALVAPDSLEGCSGSIAVWLNARTSQSSYLDFGEETSIWVLDVAGTRLLIRTMDLPDTTPQERAQTQVIFDSIQLEPLPTPPSPVATE